MERYIWEKTGLPIAAGKWRIYISKVIKHIKRRIRGISSNNSMNPFDYWYETNINLRNTFEEYYKQNISLLNDYSSLKEDAKYLFEQGNTLEKT